MAPASINAPSQVSVCDGCTCGRDGYCPLSARTPSPTNTPLPTVAPSPMRYPGPGSRLSPIRDPGSRAAIILFPAADGRRATAGRRRSGVTCTGRRRRGPGSGPGNRAEKKPGPAAGRGPRQSRSGQRLLRDHKDPGRASGLRRPGRSRRPGSCEASKGCATGEACRGAARSGDRTGRSCRSAKTRAAACFGRSPSWLQNAAWTEQNPASSAFFQPLF